MRRVFCGMIGVVVSAMWGAQDPLYFLPADRVSVRVMSELAPVDLAPGVHVRTVVGATGSVSVGDFDSGSAAVLHHHTREQADIGLTGTFDMTIGAHVEKLGPDAGVIVPANVDHSIANKGTNVMTVIEFHTVPRPDLVPPRPAMTFPLSPQPVQVPDSRMFVTPLLSSKAIHGETCTLMLRRIVRGARPASVQANLKELFIYVMRGGADLQVNDSVRPVVAGTVIVIPPHQQVSLPVTSGSEIVFVQFSTEPR